MRPCIILLLFVVAGPLYAGGGLSPLDYENYIADNSTALHSAEQLVNQAQQIHNQIQSIQYQAENLGHVSNYQWQNISGLVQHLDSVTQQGQSLSYASSNLDALFKKKYQNYSNSPQGTQNYQQTYKNWNSSTLDTLRSTLDSAGLNASDFQTEQSTLKQLEAQGKTAKGRMQVLQVSSEISAQNVNQLQELKRVVVSQTNAQNTYMAYKVSKDSYKEKSLASLADQAPNQFPKYKNNPKFGEIPPMDGQ